MADPRKLYSAASDRSVRLLGALKVLAVLARDSDKPNLDGSEWANLFNLLEQEAERLVHDTWELEQHLQ